MEQTPRRPADWRERAEEYTVKADELTDLQLYRQYAELAARYMEMAQKLQYPAVLPFSPAAPSVAGDFSIAPLTIADDRRSLNIPGCNLPPAEIH